METFSFNKVRFVLGLAVALWLGHATVMDNREMTTNRHEVKIEFLLTLAVALPLVWLVRVRLQLSKHGLRYASLSGSKEMRWRDVSLLFVGWRQRYFARIIPIYRAYRIEVVDRQGARLVFGNRFQGIAALAERMGEIAAEQIAPLKLAEFKAGKTVDFGALALSQKAGVQTRTDSVQWADVVSYDVTETELAINRRLGPLLILPLHRVSMVGVCVALIAEGIGSVRKSP